MSDPSSVLVALDIDGTLADRDRVLPANTIRAVGEARAAGHDVVLATGRSLVGMLPVARELDIVSGWAVVSNGAVIVRLDPLRPDGYAVETQATFDVEPVVRLIDERAPHLTVAVEEIGWGYLTTARLPEGTVNGPHRVARHGEIWRRPVTRAFVQGAAVLDVVGSLQMLDVTVTCSEQDRVDITPRGISKASALETLRERLGISPRHTVAVGDGHNDIDMLRWAARAVAMGQAPEEVLGVADEVTDAIGEQGVVPVLRSITRRAPVLSDLQYRVPGCPESELSG